MIDGSYKCHILSYQMFQNWMKKKSAGNPVFEEKHKFRLEFPFDPSIDFLRFLRFFLRCPFSLGLQRFERSIPMSCRASTGCNWPEVSQCFFSLSIKDKA